MFLCNFGHFFFIIIIYLFNFFFFFFFFFLPCQQNISKTVGARALKRGELINNAELMI